MRHMRTTAHATLLGRVATYLTVQDASVFRLPLRRRSNAWERRYAAQTLDADPLGKAGTYRKDGPNPTRITGGVARYL
jgi:hypothetical protein